MAIQQAVRAVLFDAYGTLFDVYSVGTLAETFFPGKGRALAELWRDRQIDYSRLRTLSDRYAPFSQVTGEALDFSAAKLGLDLSDEARKALLAQYNRLDVFPENRAALETLRGMGLKLGILSNGDPAMLAPVVSAAGLEDLFDHVLSVDSVRRFKTAPEAYQLGIDAFGGPAGDIVFVSSNCWDACGATWFGYDSFWINRSKQPLEQLGVAPRATGTNMDALVDYIKSRS